VVIGLCLLVPAVSGAQGLPGDVRRDPTEILKKYLSLDSKGARLDATSYETLRPYISWTDEPIWGHVIVITDYEVIDDVKQWQVVGLMEVVIPVEFKVLGAMYYESAGFVPDPQVERVGFRVKVVKGLWRIVEPMLPPHVTHGRIVNYVRQALLDERDQARAAKLAELRDELKRAKPGK